MNKKGLGSTNSAIDQPLDSSQTIGFLCMVEILDTFDIQYSKAVQSYWNHVAVLVRLQVGMEGVALDSDLMQPDRIHPNAKCQPIMLDNVWEMAEFPLVPGHEVAGTLSAVGTSIKNLEVGTRVGLGWHSGYCMTCPSCLSGDHNLCAGGQGTIVGRHGGSAVRAGAGTTVGPVRRRTRVLAGHDLAGKLVRVSQRLPAPFDEAVGLGEQFVLDADSGDAALLELALQFLTGVFATSEITQGHGLSFRSSGRCRVTWHQAMAPGP